MPEIVITEFMDETALVELRQDYQVHIDPNLVDRPAEIEGLLAEARALIVRNRTRVAARLLDHGPRLEVIGRLGVGLDNIDLEACAARGITVCPATGANAVAVAEYVIGALLILRRGAFNATEDVAAGKWPRNDLIGGQVEGLRLGLIGFGAIAREVAQRAVALGARVTAFDAYVDPADPAWREIGVEPQALGELIAGSDAISLHVPLTDETRHLIDAGRIAAMKPQALVINSARGGVVDEQALIAALRAGRLGGAMLDVFETEPLPAHSGFAAVPNLILTPHIAGITHESHRRISEVTVANVRSVLEQKTP